MQKITFVGSNWDLRLVLQLEADEEDDIALLLEDVAEKIRKGEMSGQGNYCAGVYQFEIEEFDPAGVDDIKRTGPH